MFKAANVKPWYVAIGASCAEGLQDIREVLEGLPRTLNAVVMVVLHRPFDRPSHLRAVLDKASNMPVLIAADGGELRTGNVYIGEPAEHLTLAARSFGETVPDPSKLHANRTGPPVQVGRCAWR